MKTMVAPNPFTPKSGMEPRVFVGREKEIEKFSEILRQAIYERKYNHFLVQGAWGIGKTSLLKEFKKYAQSKGILTSNFAVREFQDGDSFLSATRHLILQMARNLPIKHEILKNYKEYLAGIGINIPFIGGGLQIPEKKELTGDPQVLLLEALEKLWHELRNVTENIVILIDDVQNYKNIPGFLTILKNVLSDESIVNNARYLFVLASTPSDWAQFLEKHHPIGRYFVPIIKLERLSEEKTFELVNKILESTGVIFENNIKQKVFEFSEGHPFELQVLCSFLYDNQIGGRVSDDVWDVSFDNAISQMGDVLLDSLFDLASPSEEKILKTVAQLNAPIESKAIIKIDRNFTGEAINKYLNRLVVKGLLIRPKRGLYAFPDRMFREYVLRKF